jgi:hypothetical protein
MKRRRSNTNPRYGAVSRPRRSSRDQSYSAQAFFFPFFSYPSRQAKRPDGTDQKGTETTEMAAPGVSSVASVSSCSCFVGANRVCRRSPEGKSEITPLAAQLLLECGDSSPLFVPCHAPMLRLRTPHPTAPPGFTFPFSFRFPGKFELCASPLRRSREKSSPCTFVRNPLSPCTCENGPTAVSHFRSGPSNSLQAIAQFNPMSHNDLNAMSK